MTLGIQGTTLRKRLRGNLVRTGYKIQSKINLGIIGNLSKDLYPTS
jgi:hypothetical protein